MLFLYFSFGADLFCHIRLWYSVIDKQMRNGLLWLFDKPRTDINMLANIKLKDKIFDFRNVQNYTIPQKLDREIR